MSRFIKSITLMILAVLFIMTCLISCTSSNSSFYESSENLKSNDEESIPESSEIITNSEIESSEEPTVEVKEDTIVSFLACPDNIIHPSVFYDAIERASDKNGTKSDFSDLHNAAYDFSPIYKNVASAIISADVAYINQETLIGGTSGPIIGYPCFNSPTPVAETVVDLGFDVVNLAHNHMLDSGNETYLQNCDTLFKSLGLTTIGYYENQEATNNVSIIECKGIKIAFLAYTYGTNGNRLSSKSDVVVPYLDKELVTRQVKLAKEIADVVIVSTHWGYENTFGINKQQREYAELMCELEVDVILGMHPHVIQPIEWKISTNGYKTLTVYSLGNFVSGMVSGYNVLGGMLSLNIVKDAESGLISIENPLFIPVVTHYTKESRVAKNDTGYRNFEIFYLKDYTEELAATHGVCRYERSHKPTLVGGGFSKQNLMNTVQKYISSEFLPNEFKSE